MGATLASAAITRWPHLTDRARLVLVTMCLQARDRATGSIPAATYYGGHHDIAARMFGVEEPTDADLLKVKRAMKELRESGAVVVAQPACRGRTTVYRLDVTGLPNQDQLI